MAVIGLILVVALAAAVVIALRTQRRARELERKLEQRRRPLEGELCVIHTPKPDDQSLRGVVRAELDRGALVLSAAVYLEREGGERGGEVLREVPVGDVVIPAYSWAQIAASGALPPSQE
jgi:hypothetical protein